MEQITVKASQSSYKVSVGAGIRHRLADFLPKTYQNVFIVSDTRIAPHYLDDYIASLLPNAKVTKKIIEPGEAAKSKEMYFDILDSMFEAQLDRKSLVLALGGGVIGDLAGFVASTYMRGIDFIQLPTTILAHDSSVGGKVAINHETGKNLIGSFYPPVAVVYDVDTITTLPEKEVRSGYAELIKEAYIGDGAFLDQLFAREKLDKGNQDQLIKDLSSGIKVKTKIVEADEKENDMRKFLNLGHTLGHAIEAEAGYGTFTHGEAVAIGMLFALELSEKRFGANLLLDEFQSWLERNQYPLYLPDLSAARLVTRMQMDKKSENKEVHMVLLREIGQPVTEKVDHDTLFDAVTSFLERMSRT
ncbi:3-dehydroquinate synthase [Terribacillus halophilus]|uniref:3-dehydroquinate synthase n=1 Tax=Terribacillus halophilus TaxID=361279 RepID=A0A1G6V3Y5_9BACI|nr:3-dehydroquinate synthase [Terribacillus halophilus]SDD47707.1 3-dehydroquinate synthase [Terribacillus halophilus]